ncbi:8080_t:CDS:10 [Acaulospora morrowiae]|uniref:8080_t:CDS:1 n=1 Tax=Acaulospora morrowiae TaxID=94023 RepID=A0A9N8ZBH0_9GLOM|nr:8080_t:CDS:10 [Acaulospora morrowiae]
MGVTLHEPFEIEQKTVNIESQNHLFNVGITIPIEIEVEKPPALSVGKNKKNGKFVQKNGWKPEKLNENGESDEDSGETSDNDESRDEEEKDSESMKDEEGDNSSDDEDDDDRNDEFAEKILVTYQGFGISLYNASRWASAVELADSTSVHLGRTSKVGGTQENSDKVVWLWQDLRPTFGVKDFRDNVESIKRVGEFERPIFSLEISPLLSEAVVLVNQDGTVSLVDTNLKRVISHCTLKDKGNKKVYWATLFNTNGSFIPSNILPATSITVLNILSSKSESRDASPPNFFFLRLCWIDTQTKKCKILCNTHFQMNLPSTFNFNPSTGKLFLLFSHGVLRIYTVNLSWKESGAKISLSENIVIHLGGILSFPEKSHLALHERHTVEIAPLMESYVAIVGRRKTPESVEQVLTVWDIQYGTMQADRVLTSSFCEVTPDKVKLSNYLCRYNCEPMTLLSAINRMNRTAEYLDLGKGSNRGIGITKYAIHPNAESPKNPVADELIQDMKLLRKTESKFLQKLLNIRKTPTPQEFTKRFIKYVKTKGHKDFHYFLSEKVGVKYEEYVKCMKDYGEHKKISIPEGKSNHIWKRESKSDSEDHEELMNLQEWRELWKEWEAEKDAARKSECTLRKLYEFIISKEKIIPELSYHFVKTIVEHCISQYPDGKPNMTFWAPEVIRCLIQKHAMSNSVVKGGIVKALIDREEWSMLNVALLYIPDIPERDLIHLLKFVISKGGVRKKTVKPSGEIKKEILTVEKVLLLIIHAPRNENMMRWNIRQLTESELIVILKILCEWSARHTLTEIIADTMSEKPVDVDDFKNPKNPSSSVNKFKKLKKKRIEFRSIIEFLTLILDIHFASFIMNKQFHSLLGKLSDRINHEVEIFESMESMRSCLELYHKRHLKNVRPIKKEQFGKRSSVLSSDADLPEYTVELFTFFGDNHRNPRLEEIDMIDESVIGNGVSISDSVYAINGEMYHGDVDVEDESIVFENGEIPS